MGFILYRFQLTLSYTLKVFFYIGLTYTTLHSFESNLASINYLYSIPETVSITDTSNAKNNQKFSLQNLNAAFLVPIKMSSQWIFMGAPKYRALFLEAENNSGTQAEKTFHSFQLGLRLIWLKSDKWTATLNVIPTVISDLDDGFSNRVWQTNGAAAAVYKSSASTWMFGLIYTRNTGDPLVLPLFGYYRKWEHIKFSAIFPHYVSSHYYTSNKFHFGFRAQLDGDKIQFDANQANNIQVQFSRIMAGPDFLFPIKPPLYIGLQFGYLFNLRDIQFSQTGELLATGSQDPVPFLKAGIFFKIPKRKKTEGEQ